MTLDKKRWLILLASCLINLCIGSLYGWSVLSGPMAAYLTQINTGVLYTTGTLAVVFTIANAVGPITMISGGYVNDRLGPKKVILTGGILFGGGMIVSGFATNLVLLILGYGLGCGLGMGMIYGCTIGNSVKFFPDKRGLIGGIATATYGLSSVILPPIANRLIEKNGISATFKILGVAFLVVICAASFVEEQCPADYAPKGYVSATGKKDGAQEKNWKEMLQDPTFYILLGILLCGAFTGMMMISQTSSMAQNMLGLSAATAALIVSMLALFNAAGRVLAGLLSDRFGRIRVILGCLLLGVFGLVCLLLTHMAGTIVFYPGICCIGFCFGAFMGVFPGLTADRFGSKNNTVNYGIMFIGFALAGILGPITISKIYAAFGNYDKAIIVAIGLAVIGIILCSVFQKRAQ